MNKEDVLNKINNALAEVLEDESIKITETMTTNDIEGWDSITKMMFVSEIEQEFDIKLSTKDIFALNQFGTFADILIEKCNNK